MEGGVADAVLGAGFTIVNSQPVKAEMSVATPKSQAKEPIQLDIVIVCRKSGECELSRPSIAQAMDSARAKIRRLINAGFTLSRNDRKVVLFGQLLTTLTSSAEAEMLVAHVESGLGDPVADAGVRRRRDQLMMFE